MNIILNGEEFSLDGKVSVSSLVENLHLDTRKIAIERNLEIVPRSQYSDIIFKDGDKVEIVGFIGGG